MTHHDLDGERTRAKKLRMLPGLIDLTALSDDDTEQSVEALCAKAVANRVAAVCIYGQFVQVAKSALDRTGVRVATVSNFPSGSEPVADVLDQASNALADGADEIDVVIPYRAIASGDSETATNLIRSIRDATTGATLKVIIESGELAEHSLIASATRVAIDEGADFVKTSTGKTPVGATMAAARIIVDEINNAPRTVGIKVSGGVRTSAEAIGYLDLVEEVMGPGWLSPATVRFGASSLLDAVLDDTVR